MKLGQTVMLITTWKNQSKVNTNYVSKIREVRIEYHSLLQKTNIEICKWSFAGMLYIRHVNFIV